jgi:hypothetical protein
MLGLLWYVYNNNNNDHIHNKNNHNEYNNNHDHNDNTYMYVYIYIITIIISSSSIIIVIINYYYYCYYYITTRFESMQIVLTNRQPPSRNSIAMFMRLWSITSWVVSMVHVESYWQVTYSTSLVSLVGFSMTLSWVGDCKTGYDWCLMLRGLYSTYR